MEVLKRPAFQVLYTIFSAYIISTIISSLLIQKYELHYSQLNYRWGIILFAQTIVFIIFSRILASELSSRIFFITSIAGGILSTVTTVVLVAMMPMEKLSPVSYFVYVLPALLSFSVFFVTGIAFQKLRSNTFFGDNPGASLLSNALTVFMLISIILFGYNIHQSDNQPAYFSEAMIQKRYEDRMLVNSLDGAIIKGDNTAALSLLNNSLVLKAVKQSPSEFVDRAITYNRLTVLKAMLDKKVGINYGNPLKNTTPLQYSVNLSSWQDNLKLISLLLDKGAEPNISDELGKSVLMHAVINENKQLITMLISHGANIHAKDYQGRTLFDYAKSSDLSHLALLNTQQHIIVNYNGPFIDKPDSSGLTPLMHSVMRQNIESARKIINNGAQINTVDLTGITALIYAVQMDNLDLVDLLLNRGADTSIVDFYGKSAVHYAELKHSAVIIEKLQLYGAELTTTAQQILQSYKQNQLSDAIDSGNKEAIRSLLKLGTKASFEQLYSLVINGKSNIADVILENGLSLNNEFIPVIVNHEYLAELPIFQRQIAVEYFLKASTSHSNTNNNSSLHLVLASVLGDLEIFRDKYYNGIEHQTIVDDIYIDHSLAASIIHQHTDIVKFLLENNATGNTLCIFNPLIMAVENTNIAIARSLIKNGAISKINECSEYIHNNTNIISIAMSTKSFQMVELLFTSGFASSTDKKSDLLVISSMLSNIEKVESYLLNGANIEHIYNGSTALISAIENNHFELVKLLLKNGANPNANTRIKPVPLNLSLKKNHRDIAHLLIEFGALN